MSAFELPAAAEWPEITAVIPTHGRPELVRKAVQSVVDQAYEGCVHCIVVHDREDADVTLEDLARPGRPVSVMLNRGRPGLAAARNAGLAEVTTDIVASLDDDDYWLPAKVRLQVEWLQANPNLWVVATGLRMLMPENRVVDWVGEADLVSHEDLLRSRRKELHSSSLMMRTKVFREVGGYDEDLPNSYAEDWEFLLRASTLGPIGIVREPLAVIKRDGGSYYTARNEIVSEALQYLLTIRPELRTTRRGYARVLGQIAFAESALGHRKAARRWARQSLTTWPLAPHGLLALTHIVTRADPRAVLRMVEKTGRGLS